jgi:toxin HigB-1
MKSMIRSFRHKGLKALYEGDRSAKVDRNHVAKLARVLSALDEATGPDEMELPGLRVNPLKGKRKGILSVWVSGNWRVTFRFEGVDVVEVDYIDNHQLTV